MIGMIFAVWVLCVVAAVASLEDSNGNYPWRSEPLLQILKHSSSGTCELADCIRIAEQISEFKGVHDSAIQASVILVMKDLERLKAGPAVSSALTSIHSSLIKLENLLVGRETLHDIAWSAMTFPVEPRVWMDSEPTQVISNQLEAIKIAGKWDELHAQYSSDTHDNVTVASVAAIVSFQLGSMSDRYAPLAQLVDVWTFNMAIISDSISPQGFRFGDKSIHYTDCSDEMKEYVKINLLMIPYANLRYHIGRELLGLPPSDPLVSTTTTTTTSTSTTLAPTNEPVGDELPSVYELLVDVFSASSSPSKHSDWGYVKDGKYVSPSDMEFWNPTFEDKGLWKGRALLIGH